MRPSEIYDLDDPLAALQFDRAVGWFGSYVERELDKVKAKGKKAKPEATQKLRQARLEQILRGKKTKRYADPAELIGG